MNSDRVERRRPNRLGIASKSKEKRPTAISPEDDLTQPSRTTPRPPNAAQARIIEKEKVLTNMQEHLAHIQELEAERAAKHQEKRDKAKQKVRSPRFEALRRLHFVGVTRIHRTMPGVVSFPNLSHLS